MGLASESEAMQNEVCVDKVDVDVAATDDAMVLSTEPITRTGSAKAIVPVLDATKIDGFSANAVPAKNTKGWPVGVHAGVLIVFVSVCLAWLLWVLALTVQPTKIMNSIMNTKDFDYGTFWLIYEPPRAIVAVGVAGLAFVAAGYMGVVSAVVVLLVKGSTTPPPGPRFESINLGAKVTNSMTNRSSSRTESIKRVAKQAAMEITNRESKIRRTMALAAKTSEIFVQCVVLAQLLEDGMPVGLCGLFSAIVILNALTSSIFCLLPYDNMGLVHVFTDTAYDFVVAVAFPLLQVLDARRRFTFDRALFKINRQMFPEGTFERTELTIADPTEVEIIVHVIDLVRINSLLKIFTRVGTSVSLLLRCTRLVEILRAKQAGVVHHPNEYPKKSRLPAVLFALAAIAIVVTTEESIRTSRAACAMHPSCVQYAHRWVAGRDKDDFTKCYCMAMIDRDITLASYDDWVAPPDRTQTLAQLATPGHLQTLQLVNRGLATIPEQLRGCKNLKHVSLFYTNTQTLPDWFGELTNLQFLHIEGKSFGPTPQQSLQTMPANLFDKMDSLLFLHLAAHPMSTLPSFDGLTNIRSMALAVLYKVQSLPSFDKLRNLERLTLAVMANLTVLPQLDHLEKLTSLVVADRGAFCCNGFLGTDRCNLTNSRCTYNVVSDMPAVTQCVSVTAPEKMASNATRAVFDKFHFSTCTIRALMLNELEVPPSRADMDQCNGTMYRQCVVPGYGVGMCYNPRWMAVSCNASPFAINMRRAQIAQKLGKPCDKEYEAWLGC